MKDFHNTNLVFKMRLGLCPDGNLTGLLRSKSSTLASNFVDWWINHDPNNSTGFADDFLSAAN